MVAGFPVDYRTVDGTSNNLAHVEWGRAGIELLRLTSPAYEDGIGSPAGSNRPGARLISNQCIAQSGPMPNSKRASNFLWQWGQFLDHDLTIVPTTDPPEPFDIPVPVGDPFFDPLGTGSQFIMLDRSSFHVVNGVRQQFNINTAYIDASQVYGSDAPRALELRTLDGTGRLKTSEGELLPFNVNGFPNFPVDFDPSFFLAGDVRANEQVGLTSMHTLFVREHNYWAKRFARAIRGATDEQIYQLARAVVAGQMQAITYREFLPMLLGPDALTPYAGYDPEADATIATEFATAAYRVGHTLLPSVLPRLQKNGQSIPAGDLRLKDAFFNPREILDHGGIDPILRGLAAGMAQEVDTQVVDDVRNFLFGEPGQGGFDLPSLNIQRGRDHGLPGYNQVRTELGLAAAADFSDISPDPAIQANLAGIYASVDDVDLWVGGLAEPHVPGAMVGETFFTILKDQFERLRDGDRFWYQRYLPPPLVRLVERETLDRVIRRNTVIGNELPKNVFIVP